MLPCSGFAHVSPRRGWRVVADTLVTVPRSFSQMKTFATILVAAAALTAVVAVPEDLSTYTFQQYCEVRACGN